MRSISKASWFLGLALAACQPSGGGGSGGHGTTGSGGSTGTGGTGGSAPAGAQVLASGLNDPMALLPVGDHVYWVENRDINNAQIKRVLVTGGTPETIVAMNGIEADLASDGTSLFWVVTHGANSYDVDMAALDGSGVKAIITQLTNLAGPIRPFGGKLYFGAYDSMATSSVYSLTPGGALKAEVPLGDPMGAFPAGTVGSVMHVDAGGVVLQWIAANGGFLMSTNAGSTPLFMDGNDPSKTWHTEGVVVVGTDVYFTVVDQSVTPRPTTVRKIPNTGGTAATIASLPVFEGPELAGDAKGLYIVNQQPDSHPGIYALDASGKATLVATSTTPDFMAQPREIRVDDSRVYFVDGGHNPGLATIYAKAR
jgi:hypothetical protein